MKKVYTLVAILVLIALSVVFLEVTKTIEKDKNYDVKVQAATAMKHSVEAVRAKKIELGIPIDLTVDFNDTGIIGESYTAMTTTLGSVESKRTSANPDMAAMLVDMLDEAGIKSGDKIAVNFSSSFPALNIATLCACKAMNITPVVISSAGASTYGANIEDFIYLEMEKLIYDMGIVKDKSIAASVGGGSDVGNGMEPATVEKIENKIKSMDIIFIDEADYTKNLQQRLSIYDSFGTYKCFVNVGGNLASGGKNEEMINMHGGLQTRKNIEINDKSGLVEIFLSRGIPVIHLLNIKDLAVQYNIPVDPIGFGVIGEGAVYHKYEYNKAAVLIVLLAVTALLTAYRKGIKQYGKYRK